MGHFTKARLDKNTDTRPIAAFGDGVVNEDGVKTWEPTPVSHASRLFVMPNPPAVLQDTIVITNEQLKEMTKETVETGVPVFPSSKKRIFGGTELGVPKAGIDPYEKIDGIQDKDIDLEAALDAGSSSANEETLPISTDLEREEVVEDKWKEKPLAEAEAETFLGEDEDEPVSDDEPDETDDAITEGEPEDATDI